MKTKEEIKKELDQKTKEVGTLEEKITNLSKVPNQIRENAEKEMQVNAHELQQAFGEINYTKGYKEGLEFSLDVNVELASEKAKKEK